MTGIRNLSCLRAPAGVALAICVLALLALLAACGRAPDAATLPERAEIGRPFPKFALQYAGGEVLSTHSFKGKLVVLNVWATWCPPCRREMPDLEKLSRTLDPARFAVIGMATDEDALLAEEFLRANGIGFANFFDRGGSIAKQLGMQVYPETFIISQNGVLLERIAGLREWADPAMVAWLEATYRDNDKNNENNTNRKDQ